MKEKIEVNDLSCRFARVLSLFAYEHMLNTPRIAVLYVKTLTFIINYVPSIVSGNAKLK